MSAMKLSECKEITEFFIINEVSKIVFLLPEHIQNTFRGKMRHSTESSTDPNIWTIIELIPGMNELCLCGINKMPGVTIIQLMSDTLDYQLKDNKDTITIMGCPKNTPHSLKLQCRLNVKDSNNVNLPQAFKNSCMLSGHHLHLDFEDGIYGLRSTCACNMMSELEVISSYLVKILKNSYYYVTNNQIECFQKCLIFLLHRKFHNIWNDKKPWLYINQRKLKSVTRANFYSFLSSTYIRQTEPELFNSTLIKAGRIANIRDKIILSAFNINFTIYVCPKRIVVEIGRKMDIIYTD